MNLSHAHLHLGTSLTASTVVHSAVILAGLFAWSGRMAAPVPATFEVTLGDISTESGVAHRQVVKSRPQEIKRSSPLDLAVEKTPRKSAQDIAQPGVPLKEGKGGESAQSRARALSEWEQYQALIHERVHQALLYPRMSKNLGETGRVKVRFTILRDGTIAEVDLSGPSAFERLNFAALETVRRIAKLDPLPSSYAGERFQTVIPIDYILR